VKHLEILILLSSIFVCVQFAVYDDLFVGFKIFFDKVSSESHNDCIEYLCTLSMRSIGLDWPKIFTLITRL
jgi:hypothetical protein